MIPILAGLILIGGLVGVGVYAIHKLIGQRGKEGEEASSPRPRGTRSDSELMFSTVQGLTRRVKAQDTQIEESRLALNLAAEQERIQQTIFRRCRPACWSLVATASWCAPILLHASC